MINVSLLSSYDYCARKLFLEQVLKMAAIPGESIIKGSIRHAVHDRTNRIEESFVKSIKKEANYDELLDKYKKLHSDILQESIIKNKSKLTELKISMKEFFQENWPLVLQESQHRAHNLHEFMSKRKVFGDELWKLFSPKIESEYYIQSDELMMKGVIDALEVYDNKIVREVVPYELKTGSAPREGVWPGHKLQTGAYILLLEKNRMIVREAFVKYLDINEARPVIMNPFLERKVLETRDNVIRLFKGKDLPDFCSSESKCSSCPLHEQCHNEKFLKEKLSLIS